LDRSGATHKLIHQDYDLWCVTQNNNSVWVEVCLQVPLLEFLLAFSLTRGLWENQIPWALEFVDKNAFIIIIIIIIMSRVYFYPFFLFLPSIPLLYSLPSSHVMLHYPNFSFLFCFFIVHRSSLLLYSPKIYHYALISTVLSTSIW